MNLNQVLRGALTASELVAMRPLLQKLIGHLLTPPPLVFSTPKYARLAREIVEASSEMLELGQDERKTHKDGRGWHRFVSDVEGRDVIIIGGTINDNDWMEVYRMAYNAAYWKARHLKIVLPYHGDARQERAQQEGESVDGLYASAMFAAVPKTPNGNEVFLVDIHADAVSGFFEASGMRTRNVEALSVIIDRVVSEHFGGKCVLASPDAGRGKVVQKKAKKLKLRAAIASKDRDGNDVETLGLIGDVKGQNVLLSDDLAVSCDSAIGAGRILRDAGALDMVLACTHPVLPKNPKTGQTYVKDLHTSGVFSRFYITDSIPQAYDLAEQFPGFVFVEPLAPILVQQLIK